MPTSALAAPQHPARLSPQPRPEGCRARIRKAQNLKGSTAGKGGAGVAAASGKRKDRKRLAAVAALPCCICTEYGMAQASPTQVHHCIHGRYSTTKAPDSMTIPLCEGHHQGLFDTSKLALHRAPATWRETYGADTDWLSWTEERL